MDSLDEEQVCILYNPLHLASQSNYLWDIFLDISPTLFLNNTVTEDNIRLRGDTALIILQPHLNFVLMVKQSCKYWPVKR